MSHSCTIYRNWLHLSAEELSSHLHCSDDIGHVRTHQCRYHPSLPYRLFTLFQKQNHSLINSVLDIIMFTLPKAMSVELQLPELPCWEGRSSATLLQKHSLEGRRRKMTCIRNVAFSIKQRKSYAPEKHLNKTIILTQEKQYYCSGSSYERRYSAVPTVTKASALIMSEAWWQISNPQVTGEKRNQYFFSVRLVGGLFRVFDTLTFCSLWICPGYTYRVSLDWLRAVKSGFVQCFEHFRQCPASPPTLTLLHYWETSFLAVGKSGELVGILQKQRFFLHEEMSTSIASCWETYCLHEKSAG